MLKRLTFNVNGRTTQRKRSSRSSSLANFTPTTHRNRSSSQIRSLQREITVPVAKPPQIRGGNLPKTFSEEVENAIRHQFHVLLTKKVYPTVEILFNQLHATYPDFPILSKTSLREYMHMLGFTFKQISNTKIPLEGIEIEAQRAIFYRKMGNLRSTGAHIFYHDETWSNASEEKRSIWFSDTREGRLRKSDGKGARLAISAIIDQHGFHLPSVEIFNCTTDHNMDSEHFIKWIKSTSFRLRDEHGPNDRICIIIDNATLHSELTDDTKPAKRAWRKSEIQQWLIRHRIHFDPIMTKAELLELASISRPAKRYKVDEVAKQFDVEIVRLPTKHCEINPMELVWAALKDYIRKNNVRFRLNDVYNLAAEFIAGFDEDAAKNAIQHARQVEHTFRTGDRFVEENVEPYLKDTDSDTEVELDIEDEV
ncbi:unnamed protein product [Rotaria socialis]|uniref:Tc1-like transposase DDE domain-containing protein n=2 Tax=Rotaria TaxID=231623 RepID=A0A821N6U1_9BILA|nr:unnamed protein product [Rotaria socialis]